MKITSLTRSLSKDDLYPLIHFQCGRCRKRYSGCIGAAGALDTGVDEVMLFFRVSVGAASAQGALVDTILEWAGLS